MTHLAPMCPYCSRPARMVLGSALYQRRTDLAERLFWACKPCDAWVGCHTKGSYEIVDGQRVDHDGTEPLGTLANFELRTLRGKAHTAFDWIWRSRVMPRQAAYAWLSKELGVPVPQCHIAMLPAELCRRVVALMAERVADGRIKQFDPRETTQGASHG